MIAYINGRVIEKMLNTVVIDVTGVGYEIFTTENDASNAQIDENKKFYTYHSVKETAEELYGFSSLAGKKLFEMLISVQGVGPKAALAILNLGDAETVRNAIATANAGFISKATGVGKKSAERIVVDLRDKVGLPSKIPPADQTGPTDSILAATNDDALDALMALGFNMADATTYLANIPRDLPTEERIRLALKARAS